MFVATPIVEVGSVVQVTVERQRATDTASASAPLCVRLQVIGGAVFREPVADGGAAPTEVQGDLQNGAAKTWFLEGNARGPAHLRASLLSGTCATSTARSTLAESTLMIRVVPADEGASDPDAGVSEDTTEAAADDVLQQPSDTGGES